MEVAGSLTKACLPVVHFIIVVHNWDKGDYLPERTNVRSASGLKGLYLSKHTAH